jgi:hypothetical protein
MATETDFESLIVKYPELIENGLTLVGRQVYTSGGRIDLLFRDSDGRSLTAELKWRALKDQDVVQIGRYVKGLRDKGDLTSRFMLVAPRVPNITTGGMEFFGVEWKEIIPSQIIQFLEAKGDERFLNIFRSHSPNVSLASGQTPDSGFKDANQSQRPAKSADIVDRDTFKNFTPEQLQTLAELRRDLGVEAARTDVRKWFRVHKRREYAPSWIVKNRYIVKKNEYGRGAICILDPDRMPPGPFPKVVDRGPEQ